MITTLIFVVVVIIIIIIIIIIIAIQSIKGQSQYHNHYYDDYYHYDLCICIQICIANKTVVWVCEVQHANFSSTQTNYYDYYYCTDVFSASDGLMYDIVKNKIKIQQII